MGILQRFSDIMSANVNALLDKAEDPEKMVDQCIRNLNSDLSKVKDETAAVMAEEKRAKRELDECTAEIEKMQDLSVKAIEAGNDEDAKKFIEKKAQLTQKQGDLTRDYETARQNAENMRAMHDKLVKDLEELSSRREAVKGKIAAAKAQQHRNEMAAKMGSAQNSFNSSVSAFKRYENMADTAMDKANAMAELNLPDSTMEDLESKYNVSNAEVETELAALKASLGK